MVCAPGSFLCSVDRPFCNQCHDCPPQAPATAGLVNSLSHNSRSMTRKSSLVPQLGRLASTDPNVSLLELLLPEPALKRIHKSPATIVCTAQLRSSMDMIVLKMATHADAVDRLKHEYAMYRRLQAMQGDQIPRCYGLFLPRRGEDGVVSRQLPGACLLLEYCGEHCQIGQPPQPVELRRTRALDEMPWKFR